MLLHARLRLRVAGAAVLRDVGVLVVNVVRLHLRRPHPGLHDQPPAQVDAKEGAAAVRRGPLAGEKEGVASGAARLHVHRGAVHRSAERREAQLLAVLPGGEPNAAVARGRELKGVAAVAATRREVDAAGVLLGGVGRDYHAAIRETQRARPQAVCRREEQLPLQGLATASTKLQRGAAVGRGRQAEVRAISEPHHLLLLEEPRLRRRAGHQALLNRRRTRGRNARDPGDNRRCREGVHAFFRLRRQTRVLLLKRRADMA
mmetsp:Transcript_18386/g.53123  ORF Transcript_18386/g.53123 Transcript_18386/m.53123 type:complete len:260 (+) Transcript_18386:1255-2034(+)